MGNETGPRDTEPASAVLPTAPARGDVGAPPSLPTAPAAVLTSDFGPPPAMPSMAAPGTIQLRALADTTEDRGGAPVMPTLTGEPIPHVVPPSMPPARYEVGREIARGGMGRVVEATDTTLGRVVALKEALSTEADALRRFQREIKITARLEHPAIVPVHDAGNTTAGTPFYVMRKVSGRPLEELVATSHTLGPRLALIPHIVASAQAVAHAHGRGIVHRDIKPSNILVGDLGETIVIDWGLAKAIDEPDDASSSIQLDSEDLLKTRVGVVFGTPGFMAPEQLQGAPVDERCDVYALGATLYHLLTRKPPHHAKTADLMMRAAVDGPPTPVAAIVAGVPPELATIVDKALALDPEERYQTAKSLAEDLQRFLTGKLIASHHYTAMERLVRFVRRNRVPVIAVIVATLALIIGGAIAVSRVVDERDRADDSARVAVAEKLEAEARADQLTLTQARYNVETNPALAVAMIKPLALKYWREVRGIAAAARSAGIAFSLPASANTLALQLSPDGRHAVASGEDGVVRTYDLVARTSQVVAELHQPVRVRFADGDRRLVAFHGATLTILDPALGTTRTITAASPILDLEVSGTTAYWADATGVLWQLELAGGPPAAVKTEEAIKQVSTSPDGHWVALIGVAHLWLIDRNRPPEAPLVEVMMGVTRDVGWAADSGHLAALVGTNLLALDMSTVPIPTIVHKQDVGQRFAVAYGAGKLYTVGPTGVAVISSSDSLSQRPLMGTAIGIHESRGGTMIVGAQGNLAMLSDGGDHQLASPVEELIMVEASPRSPYVVAAAIDKLLVWNVDDIQPRQVISEAPAAAGFVGGDQLIASFVDAPAQWIDLATGKVTTLGMMPAARQIAAPPGAHPDVAALIDLTHHARIVSPGHDAVELVGEVDLAGFLTGHQVVLATRAGALRLYDTEAHQEMALRSAGVKLAGIGWSRGPAGGTVAAAFEDGTLWRHDLGSGREDTIAVRPTGNPVAMPDGTVFYADGAALHAWRASGKRDLIATLPRPIADLGVVDSAATVFTNEGVAYVVDLATGTIGSPLALGANAASMSADTALIVSRSRGGALDVVDPIVKQKWTLAAQAGLVYSATQISADGRRVLALTRRSLLVWTLELPTGAPAMPAWLAAMTNATVERSELTWPVLQPRK